MERINGYELDPAAYEPLKRADLFDATDNTERNPWGAWVADPVVRVSKTQAPETAGGRKRRGDQRWQAAYHYRRTAEGGKTEKVFDLRPDPTAGSGDFGSISDWNIRRANAWARLVREVYRQQMARKLDEITASQAERRAEQEARDERSEYAREQARRRAADPLYARKRGQSMLQKLSSGRQGERMVKKLTMIQQAVGLDRGPEAMIRAAAEAAVEAQAEIDGVELDEMATEEAIQAEVIAITEAGGWTDDQLDLLLGPSASVERLMELYDSLPVEWQRHYYREALKAQGEV